MHELRLFLIHLLFVSFPKIITYTVRFGCDRKRPSAYGPDVFITTIAKMIRASDGLCWWLFSVTSISKFSVTTKIYRDQHPSTTSMKLRLKTRHFKPVGLYLHEAVSCKVVQGFSRLFSSFQKEKNQIFQNFFKSIFLWLVRRKEKLYSRLKLWEKTFFQKINCVNFREMYTFYISFDVSLPCLCLVFISDFRIKQFPNTMKKSQWMSDILFLTIKYRKL